MEKVLEYKLKPEIKDGFPFMPVLHDYKVDEIRINNNVLIVVSNDLENHDDDSFDFTGFHAKKVRIEFIFENDVKCEEECNVIVSQYFPKKQIRDRGNGYGKRSNIYNINEFLNIYRDYNLEILFYMVSYGQVNLKLAGNKKKIKNIEIEIFCKEVRYIFSD